MAFEIGTAILAAIGTTATVGTATVVGSVAITAASLGAQYGLAALTAEKPRSEAQQATLSQAMSARVGIYGRAMVGGTRFFWDARNGTLFQGIILAGHRIDGIEQYWIGDKPVATTDGEFGGPVTTFPYLNRVGFEPHLGLDDQPASGLLMQNYPEIWTPQHQLKGLANVVAVFNPVKKEDQQTVFPQGYATVLRFVIRGARVWDLGSTAQDPDNPATWTWSESPSRCIVDYLRRRDGVRFPLSTIDVPSFVDHAALCAEAVARKDGSVEPRYRLGGTYLFTDTPKDVLQRMGDTCDSQIVQGPSGKYGIRGGRYRSPLVTISTKDIVTADVAQGVDRIDGYNKLVVSYTEPENFYQATQVDAYQDAASQARVGVVDQTKDLVWVPSWTQAARLAKIRFHKDNPLWQGTLGTLLPGLAALGEDAVHVTFDPVPEIGALLDDAMSVTAMSVEGDASGCGLGIASVSAATYSWDAALEEPAKPTTPQTINDVNALASPTDVAVTADRRIISGGNSAVWGLLTWSPSPRADAVAEPQYRLTSAANTAFRAMALRENQVSAEGGPLTDTENYVFRVRFRAGGAVSDWSAVVPLAISADPTAPGAPTGFVANGGAGQASVAFTAPNSANFGSCALYRGTTTSFASAAIIRTLNGSASQSFDFSDTGRAPGTYRYWVRALNRSGFGDASSTVGPMTVTVT